MKKNLLIVAHGSRRSESNEEVRALSKKINALECGFDEVSCAFLELATPLIPAGIEKQIECGANEIVILPYFLSAGRHVTKDIPSDVEQVKAKHPNINIKIAPHFGAATGISRVLIEHARL